MTRKFYFLLIVLVSFTTYQIEGHSLDIPMEVGYDDDASFYMTPTCDGAIAIITGDLGGAFDFNPAPGDGAVIDPITGAVTNGTPGVTYTVEYTTAGPTPETSSQSFTVLITDDASFFMTPTCDGATATITGTLGGTFAFNPTPPDGAAIYVATGEVIGGIPGTIYSVEYTTSGSCGSSSIETFIAGCLFGVIEVNAFVDENSNSVFDASELNFNQGVITYEINNDGIIHYMSSYYGAYLIPIFEEGNTYDISFTLSEVYNSCLSQTFALVEDVTVAEGETVHVDFPLTQMGDCNEIGIYLTSNAPPRPGQINYNILAVVNSGTEPISGSVDFSYDESLSLLDVLYVEPGNSVTNTATGFVLNFNDLQPGEEEAITARLYVPTSAMAGDLLTSSAVYNVSDLNIDNNESILTQVVVNSYDPNDKAESHGGKIEIDDFTDEDYLFYTIRFQNLGTADAIDISVEDVLDTQLDASSFKMLHSSHNYLLTRVDNNLTWEFENVNLPSESMDEPNSHGYIYFKIKPEAGYALGDIIPNTADIYFDFNDAVITNTFETEFVENLSVDEFSSTSFSMYPNPANETVNIEFNSAISEDISVAIFDVQGKLVLKMDSEIEFNTIQFDVSGLSRGLYFVELKVKNFKMVEKLIVE